jgi:biopolymer transport protein TolR
MALSVHDAFAAGRRNRRRRGRRAALSEINVTPLVDVMLVLLIIFMISAPLLTAGVPLELPKTEAAALANQNQPLTISIRQDGTIFLQDSQIPFEELGPQVRAVARGEADKPIYVRADGRASYEVVARVMASLSTSGFSQINLLTDTGGPSSGAKPPAEPPPEASP